jgi:hypothetical protein
VDKAESSTPDERDDENAVPRLFVIDFVQPDCKIQVLLVLAAPFEGLRPQSNPMWFVQSCRTNSALRRPKAFVCPRVHTGLVAVSILLELCPRSIYVRLLFAPCQAPYLDLIRPDCICRHRQTRPATASPPRLKARLSFPVREKSGPRLSAASETMAGPSGSGISVAGEVAKPGSIPLLALTGCLMCACGWQPTIFSKAGRLPGSSVACRS